LTSQVAGLTFDNGKAHDHDGYQPVDCGGYEGDLSSVLLSNGKFCDMSVSC